MSGSVNFLYGDVYGAGWSTTEETVPEAADQNALVDNEKAAETASVSGQKRVPVLLAVVLVIILAFVIGGLN